MHVQPSLSYMEGLKMEVFPTLKVRNHENVEFQL